jgi:Domain of unknown function (DUF5664)
MADPPAVRLGKFNWNSPSTNSKIPATDASGPRELPTLPFTNFANTSDGGDKMNKKVNLHCPTYNEYCLKSEDCLAAARCLDHPVLTVPERLVPRSVEAKDSKSNNDRINPKDKIGATKIPLRFIPLSSLTFLARVMELGAIKYGPMNWRENDVRSTIYYEAALRHIFAALDGEELDPESGQPHAAHAMACMAILLDAGATGNVKDDRFAPGAFGRLVREMTKKETEK